MKIDRVIISSTNHKNYIDFWPIVSKSWKKLEINPTLIYTSDNDFSFDDNEEVIPLVVEEVDPIFVAQNIRLLAPALFPNEVCILSDIDILPLSKNYFFKHIKEFNDNDFVIYRPDACPPQMLALCYNVGLGSTWGEIFDVSNKKEIKDLIKEWYPDDYVPFKKNWYFDQIILRNQVDLFKEKHPSRVKILNDDITNFNRLNRDNLKKDMKKYLSDQENYSDFHMPRPFSYYQRKIEKIYEKAFYGNN